MSTSEYISRTGVSLFSCHSAACMINASTRFNDGFEIGLTGIVLHGDLPPFMGFDFGQQGLVDCRALLDCLGGRSRDLAKKHFPQARISRTVEDRAFVVAVLCQPFLFLSLDGAGPVVDVNAVTVENTDFNHSSGNARREPQRYRPFAGSGPELAPMRIPVIEVADERHPRGGGGAVRCAPSRSPLRA